MVNRRRVPYTKPIPPGAELFTRKGKRFARYKDARGKAREAPVTEDGTRLRLLSKKLYGEHHDGERKRCVPLSADKTAAQQMLAELIRKAELKKANISDPYEEPRRRPLVEHLEDFRTALLVLLR